VGGAEGGGERASERARERERESSVFNLVAVDAGAYGVDDELKDVGFVSDLVDGKQVLMRELQRV